MFQAYAGLCTTATCRQKYARGETDSSLLLGNVNTAMRHRYLQDVHPHYHRSASYKSVVGVICEVAKYPGNLIGIWDLKALRKLSEIQALCKKEKNGNTGNATKEMQLTTFCGELTSGRTNKQRAELFSQAHTHFKDNIKGIKDNIKRILCFLICMHLSFLSHLFYRAALFPSRGFKHFFPPHLKCSILCVYGGSLREKAIIRCKHWKGNLICDYGL